MYSKNEYTNEMHSILELRYQSLIFMLTNWLEFTSFNVRDRIIFGPTWTSNIICSALPQTIYVIYIRRCQVTPMSSDSELFSVMTRHTTPCCCFRLKHFEFEVPNFGVCMLVRVSRHVRCIDEVKHRSSYKHIGLEIAVFVKYVPSLGIMFTDFSLNNMKCAICIHAYYKI